MDDKAITRAITRISHEIIEKNKGIEDIIIVGIKTRGIPLCLRIRDKIQDIEGSEVPGAVIDITGFRDDLKHRNAQEPGPKIQTSDSVIHMTNRLLAQLEESDVNDKTVILVDDVMHTGRTCRAAIDGILHIGRPKRIQFAALIDRGHRELPLRPDFVGKNVPTSQQEIVHVQVTEIDAFDRVIIE